MTGKYARGLETDLEVLRQFALNKEVLQYGLDKKVGLSYRTILRTLHSLEKLGMLRIIRKEESEKKGKEKNVWEITLKGILELLYVDENAWKQVDLIAKAHEKKLLVFRKWRLFARENLTTLILKALKRTLESIAKGQLSLMVFYSAKMEWTEEERQKLIDSMTIGSYALRRLKQFRDNKVFKEEILKILKVCKKDEELRSFVVDELSFFKEIAKDNLHWIGEAEKLFDSL